MTTGLFGDDPVQLRIDDASGPPEAAIAWSADTLAGLRDPAAGGVLRIHRPAPTAAFSRRDSLLPGYPAAAEAVKGHGYTPVIRPAGGRLAAYHEGSLVLDLVARHRDPHRHLRERFAAFATCLTAALTTLGMDARVGEVPGEYCPGEFSVNAGGTVKLAGTAQRVTQHGFLFAVVLLVENPEPVREVLRTAYPLLGLPWRPETVGCVAEHAPGTTVDDVVALLVPALRELVPLA